MARGGWKLSEETRRKISEARKGRKGASPSEETRSKLSAVLRGRPSPLKGSRLGEETRAKMSAAHRGKAHDEEARAKIGAAHRGKVVSAETRERIGAASRRVPRSGRDNVMWGKSPPHGKRIAHKGHVFRSSYEVRCADALDRKGIKWQYEPKRFDLGDCTYLPDFYLPEQDVYWEVKGWLGPNSQRKINRFREVHPEIPLVVVTNSVLKLLEK